MSAHPDAQTIATQLLLAFARTGRLHGLRRLWLGLGGYAMLRAAGLGSSRARAVHLMARRVADDWRRQGHDVTPGRAADEAARLLR